MKRNQKDRREFPYEEKKLRTQPAMQKTRFLPIFLEDYRTPLSRSTSRTTVNMFMNNVKPAIFRKRPETGSILSHDDSQNTGNSSIEPDLTTSSFHLFGPLKER